MSSSVLDASVTGTRRRNDEPTEATLNARAVTDRPPAGNGLENGNSSLSKLKQKTREVEREQIIEALRRCGGNQTRAAKELGISRRTLVSRLSEYDIPRPIKDSRSE